MILNKGENGVAALEFAIVLPFLILLAVGICEFGFILYNQQVLTNAAREGARAGIVQRTDDDGIPLYSEEEIKDLLDGIVQDYVWSPPQVEDNKANRRLVTFGEYIAPTFPSPFPIGINGSFGQDLTVRVTWVYEFLVSSLFGLGTDIELTGETTMKMEQVLAAGS
jgi:hypothetical protein